jgi:hypothetical protein
VYKALRRVDLNMAHQSARKKPCPIFTLSIDEEVIRRVRKITIEKNTSMTQMVREFLESVAKRDAALRINALESLEASFMELERDMGKRDWTREDLYER